MSGVLVDSNVLIDVTTRYGDWYARTLARCIDKGRVVINPLIYAEISVHFERVEDLDRFLPRTSYKREALPWKAAYLAGQAFVTYRRRGGARTSPIADFYIGAHAAVARYDILTRDARRYRTYFPTVRLISPPDA